MISSNKLQGFSERVNGMHKPITADVFLTDYCNNRCVYCRYNHDNGNYMRFEEFVAYAKTLLSLGVKGIILTGGGEPTINPNFERICDWLERNNIDYGINTNLNKQIFVRPNFLKVSIDSGDPAEYAKLRGRNTLSNVLHNLEAYLMSRDKNGWRTKVGVQCVATSVAQAKSFYEAIKGYNVDYIQFRPLEKVGEQIDYSEILAYVDELKKTDERISKSFKYELIGYKPGYCLSNWSIITVDTKGNVPYCCHRPDDIVGHIFDLDIIEKLAHHHVDMRQCEVPCRLSGTNYYLDNYKKGNDINFV